MQQDSSIMLLALRWQLASRVQHVPVASLFMGLDGAVSVTAYWVPKKIRET